MTRLILLKVHGPGDKAQLCRLWLTQMQFVKSQDKEIGYNRIGNISGILYLFS
jgi:hypothetical protein